MLDQSIFQRINELAGEEEELYRRAGDGSGLDGSDRDRLAAINVELDRCYDLLAQRKARIAAGLDPSEAEARPADIVEHYQQ